MAGHPAGAAEGVDGGPAAVVQAGLVGLHAFFQGQVPSPEDLDADGQFPGGRASALDGAFGASGQGLDVFDRGRASTAGVVVGVLGVGGHDPDEGVRGYVVSAKHTPALGGGGGQHRFQPMGATAPRGDPGIGTRCENKPRRSLDPAVASPGTPGPSGAVGAPAVVAMCDRAHATRGLAVARSLTVIKACATLRAA
jgi:hypothetical protein